MFSILIPSWNNLDYLKLAIASIRRHSTLKHQILVHVNEGSDGTVEWLCSEGIEYTYSSRNLGVCLSVNQLVGLARHDWIVFLNDDMYCCPGWDAALQRAIDQTGGDLAFYSSRLIEPTATGNPLVLVRDLGRGPADFDEQGLLAGYADPPGVDTLGAGSQPTVVARRWWQMLGGYSIEFSPGMTSDWDLLMKFWIAGCREFRVVDSSRIYHFACRSTGRIRKNRGGRSFVMKWGITEGEFRRALATARPGDTSQAPLRATPLGRLKRAVYGLGGDFPLQDLAAWDPAPGVQALRPRR